MTTAGERKQRTPEPEHKPGRTSKVKSYTIKGTNGEKTKRKGSNINPAFIPPMGKSTGLSPEARFDMLKPDCVHPLDWFRLFTPDESLWEAMQEEAVEAVESGEMKRYERVGR